MYKGVNMSKKITQAVDSACNWTVFSTFNIFSCVFEKKKWKLRKDHLPINVMNIFP